jgi:hypothetical protein
METLRNDALQREVEAKIREVEQRAENATDAPLVVMSSTSSNSSSTAGTTQLTPPSNNPRQPDVEEERTYPMLVPPSPTRQQGGSTSQQQRSWSPSLHGGCAGYSSFEPGSAHAVEIGFSTHNTSLPVPPVDNLQQGSWIQTPPLGVGSHADGRPTLPHYGYVEPIGQSQHLSPSTTLDVRNSGQLPYPHGNAVSNPQQGFPQFLLAGPYPYPEGNLLHPYRRHSPQFLHLGGLDYVGENAYRPSPSNYSPQPSSPRAQQPSAGYLEDDYFVGGFNPYLRYQPR